MTQPENEMEYWKQASELMEEDIVDLMRQNKSLRAQVEAQQVLLDRLDKKYQDVRLRLSQTKANQMVADRD